MHPEYRDRIFSHRLCQAKTSEKQAHGHFVASKEPWSLADIRRRHEGCHGPRFFEHVCFKCASLLLGPTARPHMGLNVTLLRCCRQIYQDARSTVFSANTISFLCPSDFQVYGALLPIPGLPLETRFLIRRLHLGILVGTKSEEQRWIKVLKQVTRNFRSLQYLYIDIEQHTHQISCLEEWCFEDPAKSSFLGGLRMLRDLKLRAVTVTISDCPIIGTQEESVFENRMLMRYRWTMMQKQVWAAYVTRLLLRQEHPDPLTGKGF